MAQNRGLRPSPYSVFLHESCRYPASPGGRSRERPPGGPAGRRTVCRKRSFATHADQLRPRLEDRRLPVAGPAARRLRASTTRPTSTTTSFPASATTGRDSTDCLRARPAGPEPRPPGQHGGHVVQNKVEAAYARSDLFDRRGASDGRLGCLPHRATRTPSMPESRLADLMCYATVQHDQGHQT